MASRDRVGWNGVHQENAAFMYDNDTIEYDATEDGGSDAVGLAVTLADVDGEIKLVGDGEFVLGKLLKVEADGFCSVQVGGFMTLPGGDGADLTLGKAIVGDLGDAAAKGYIREVTTATAEELGVQRGFIVDAQTTTAVWVRL
jgi:hypothetical protein